MLLAAHVASRGSLKHLPGLGQDEISGRAGALCYMDHQGHSRLCLLFGVGTHFCGLQKREAKRKATSRKKQKNAPMTKTPR